MCSLSEISSVLLALAQLMMKYLPSTNHSTLPWPVDSSNIYITLIILKLWDTEMGCGQGQELTTGGACVLEL